MIRIKLFDTDVSLLSLSMPNYGWSQEHCMLLFRFKPEIKTMLTYLIKQIAKKTYPSPPIEILEIKQLSLLGSLIV